MIELLLLAFLLVVALAIGNLILPIFRTKIRCFMEQQVVAAGLGFAFLIIAVYLLAAGHVLSNVSILSLLILGLITGRRSLVRAILAGKNCFDNEKPVLGKWYLAFMAVLAVMMLFNLVGALSPTTDTDGLAYHLAVPKFYLEHGGFVYNPITVFNWPASIEMLYTIAIAISNDSLAKLLHLMFGLMSAITVYLLGREWFGKEAGIIAAVLFYAMPIVGLESGIAYVDLATTFYLIMGIHLFLRWYLKDEQTLGLAGIFVGVGASTKWNGPVILGILALFCLYKVVRNKQHAPAEGKESVGRSKQIIAIIFFLLIASSFTLIWYAKNYALTGNPVAPFLGNIVETRDWSSVNTDAYKASVASLYLSPIQFFMIPWALTMNGQPFGELTFLGPWFLMILPLILLIKKWPGAVKFILLSSFMYYGVWFLTSQQSRLLIPHLALLCAVCGWVLTTERVNHMKKFLLAFLFISVVFALPFTAVYNGKGIKTAIGLESKEEYLHRVLPDASSVLWVNNNLPAESKIFLVREDRIYLMDREYLWGDRSMQGVLDLKADANEMYKRMKTLGITHIIVNRAIKCTREFEESHCPDIKNILEDKTTKDKIQLIHEQNEVYFYRVL